VSISFESRKATLRLYDHLSRWYDLLSGPAEERARLYALNLLTPQAGEWVVEIGSGTGSMLGRMGQGVGERGQVLGVDLSENMMRVAAKKVEGKKMISLARADAIQLPITAGRVDAVFMSFTLELFSLEEIPMVLAECRRILRHGGRLCVLAMSRPTPEPILVKIYTWLHNRMPNWLDCRPVELKSILEANGFNILRAEQGSIFGLPVEMILAQ